MNTRIRSYLATLLATVTLTALGMLIPTSAQAQVGDLDCEAAFQFTFDPPLSAANPEEKPHIDAVFTNCLSLNGQYTDLHSGDVDAMGTAVLSTFPVNPCALLFTMTGSGNIRWSNQQTSHFTFTVNTDPTNGTITLSAEVQSGPLAGDTASAAPIVPFINPDCPLVGLRTVGASLTIVDFS